MSILEMMKEDSKNGIKFEPIEVDDHHMVISDWIEEVKFGGYIDYDGHGVLATDTTKSNVIIQPSDVGDFLFPEWTTHIVWYNR